MKRKSIALFLLFACLDIHLIQEKISMQIKHSDIVLEIGSGDNPNPRSNVLVDKFFEPTPHRKNTPLQVDSRPIIVADAERLPFKAHSFQYVICSHLIEHIPNVEIAFAELMRVADRGYIETPSIYAERIVGKHEIHLWNVLLDNQQLILNRKTADNISPYNVEEVYDQLFADVFWANPEVFFVKYEWNSAIHYTIVNDNEMLIYYLDGLARLKNLLKPVESFDKKRLINAMYLLKRESLNLMQARHPWLYKLYAGFSKSRMVQNRGKAPTDTFSMTMERLDSMLCCPYCFGDLAKGKDSYGCDKCSRKYANEHGYVRFL